METLGYCHWIAGTILLTFVCSSPPAHSVELKGADQPGAREFSSRSKVHKGRRHAKRSSHSHRTWAMHRHRHIDRRHAAYRIRYARRGAHGGSVSMAGVVGPLAAKAQQIVATCGSRVVSAVRRGSRIRGGHQSNHASGRAVDLQGNPRCIYAMLRGWPGGVSTDYGSAPGGAHVHVSYSPGGMEWGLRFAHGRRGYTRYASARRYVSASRRTYAYSGRSAAWRYQMMPPAGMLEGPSIF